MAIKKHKTERMLLASIGILSMFLFASAFTKEIAGTKVFAEESSGASGSNDEGSQDDEKSDDSDENEESQEDEKSEPSVASTPSVRTVGTETSELSVKSSAETSQKSQSTEDEEASEASEPSEVSQEVSEESIKHVEGYGDVVSKEGNVALVKKDGKLFFLIPVEIESQVTLDEQGSVVSEEKSFLNWLLSAFSF